MPGTSTNRSPTASVTAGIAAASAHLPAAIDAGTRFPGDDDGRYLAEMAQNDLDATLQLLAERAQYITEASGAAIALRRGEHNDMLCRASAGTNAPDLGALLSMDYGLSGESVRTRQVLRCDDAERDPRVNHEVCTKLGIASVVVMPIVTGEQVLGVFELLSGKPRAFGERDLSALRRLSEMVELAVKYAVAAQSAAAVQKMPNANEMPNRQPQPPIPLVAAEVAPLDLPAHGIASKVPTAAPEKEIAPQESKPLESTKIEPQGQGAELEKTELEKQELEAKESQKNSPELSPRKQLFWSAAIPPPQGSAGPASTTTESIAVPPGLRTLQKCQACGFPVSQGRTFCVECEEKQWRGQPLPQPAAAAAPSALRNAESKVIPPARNAAGISSSNNVSKSQAKSPNGSIATSARATTVIGTTQNPIREPIPSTVSSAQPAVIPSSAIPPNTHRDFPLPVPQNATADAPTFSDSALFLSSAVNSQSWFVANRYILAALLTVAIIIGVIALLH